jgi:Holliday junction DNA helicase RuvA
VKGLGPKTAQRVIVDLKDKILKIDLGEGSAGSSGQTGDQLFPVQDSPVKSEAVSALTMLGFNAAASGKAVDKILKQTPEATVEQVIRTALKML